MPEPLTNLTIAAALDELGDLYELDGAERYRVNAYRNAARSIRDASVSVQKLIEDGKVTELAGVGTTLEGKLRALVAEGAIPQTIQLRERFPAGLLAVMHLPGFGAKRAKRLYEGLGIDSLDGLRAAAEGQRIRALKGFGAKVEQEILEALDAGADGTPEPRLPLGAALPQAEQIAAALRGVAGVREVAVAGSARRRADTVKDLDIVATADDPAAVLAALAELSLIQSASAPEDPRPGAGGRGRAATALTHTGMRVDLQVVEPDQLGNVLQHLTGSAAHNVALREAAVRAGLHVSQYGILDDSTGETIRCASEEEVYAALGYEWIPPELRENRGELEAARRDGAGLPRLVETADLKGDLHCHTVASDGRNTVRQMVEAARARGYEYLCITDHSASHGFGNNVTTEELRGQIEKVRALNAELDGFELLIGSEVNILPDGRLDYPDDLLAALDWVIASVHTAFRQSEADQTARVVAACEHPYVDAIGHLTGRKLGLRPGYAIDVHAVIAAAARTGTMLEVNSAPARRDLNDVDARAAAAAGVTIIINSDAHGAETLANVEWGVATARRAWLTAGAIANTRPWNEFAPLCKRAAQGKRRA